MTAKTMNADEFIKTFPQFKKSLRDVVPDLLAASRRQVLPKDTRIYTEGDACTAIAFVVSGNIRVYKIGETGREITLYEIGPGETCILNASCILGNTTYPANALATIDTDVILVPSDVFRRLLIASQPMQLFVFALMSQRLSSVMELVEEVAFGKMDQRILEYLVERSDHDRLETTHQNIANDLGTSREVVSRLLKELERKNRVRLSRNVITLINA